MTQNTQPQLASDALNRLFRDARTVHAFQPVPVSDETIRQLYELLKWGPTAFNAQPARYLFLRSPEAKARLRPALSSGNLAQTDAAAVTVIVAQDSRFYEHLPQQFRSTTPSPCSRAMPPWPGDGVSQQQPAGAYLILAARSLGLDSGAQSGFDPGKVNAEFFPDGRYQVNFIINLGVADPAGIHPRGPRLDFDQVGQIL